jgi:hypothetical protein
MMSEISQTYQSIKNYSKAKKQRNKHGSTSLLESNNIKFDSKNNGVHLIIDGCDEIIDFYPSTGLWIIRSKQIKSRGVRKLINRIKNRSNKKGETPCITK